MTHPSILTQPDLLTAPRHVIADRLGVSVEDVSRAARSLGDVRPRGGPRPGAGRPPLARLTPAETTALLATLDTSRMSKDTIYRARTNGITVRQAEEFIAKAESVKYVAFSLS